MKGAVLKESRNKDPVTNGLFELGRVLLLESSKSLPKGSKYPIIRYLGFGNSYL